MTTGKAPFTLMKLPYADNALEPVISARTISFHHGKHHATYVNNLNNLVKDTPYADLSLEEIVVKSAKDPASKGIFNNSAQVWNHDFYWKSMKAGGGGEPKGKLKSAIDKDFGGVAKFKEAFGKAAVGQFGSGWAWLVAGKDGKLSITTTGNADTPVAHGEKALFTTDVWEHAYYLDYQNRRPDHVNDFLAKLINWDFAEENLG
jgi:superoxide dismutase, Fe-Mn family